MNKAKLRVAQNPLPRPKVILQAATEVFASYGFSGARMQVIADRAGIPKATVLYYFSSKEALYHAALHETLVTWNKALDAFDERSDPATAIDSYIRAKVKMTFDNPAASRMFAAEIQAGAPHIKAYLSGALKKWFDGRVAVIERWVVTGKITKVDPQQLLFMLWGSTQFYATYQTEVDALCKQTPDVQRVADDLSSMVLRGLGLDIRNAPQRMALSESPPQNRSKATNGLTTHVLDTAHGCPAAGMYIELLNGSNQLLKKAVLNADGRTDGPLIASGQLYQGAYCLRFFTADYFRTRQTTLSDPPFLDVIAINFSIADTTIHYHVPLLVSPYSYSTYRGS